jgi:enamine deaminase RidA (YjgF/YER057c/UK114 family)
MGIARVSNSISFSLANERNNGVSVGPGQTIEGDVAPRELARQRLAEGGDAALANACRIGNVIVSGLIRGPDPATRKLPSVEQQCAHMVENMRLTVEAGGGTVDDIIKVTFWMEKIARKPIDDEWVKMFPDAEASGPGNKRTVRTRPKVTPRMSSVPVARTSIPIASIKIPRTNSTMDAPQGSITYITKVSASDPYEA